MALAQDSLHDGRAVSLVQLRALQSRRIVLADPPESIDDLETAAEEAEREHRDAAEAEAVKEKILGLQEDLQTAKAKLEKQKREDDLKEAEMWGHIEKSQGRLKEMEAKERGERLEVKVVDADEKALEEDLETANTEEEMKKAEAKVQAAGDEESEDKNLEKHQELEATKTAIETLRNEITDGKAEYDATVMVDKLGRLAHQKEIGRLDSELEMEKAKLKEEMKSADEESDHLEDAAEELKKQIGQAKTEEKLKKHEEDKDEPIEEPTEKPTKKPTAKPTEKPTEKPMEKPAQKPKPVATTTTAAPVKKSPFDSFGDIEDEEHTASLLYKAIQPRSRGSWAWSAW